MGVFSVTVEVGDLRGERFEPVQALVDTGASSTVIPAPLLRRLGVTPHEQRPFLLADGRTVERHIGWTWARIDGRIRMTVVVFGDEGIQPLLGAITLEEFGLDIDPVRQELIPVSGYLMLAK